MKILFVCTDNIGRSLIAELLLKHHIIKHDIDDLEVCSAGTHADSDISDFDMSHFEELRKRGIDPSLHERTQLTRELTEQSDFVVAMDTSHQQWIEDNFGVQSFLFNEILNGEKTSVTFASVDMDKIVDYIDDAIPKLIECFQKNKENNKAWEKIFRQQGVVLTEPHPDMQAISQALHAGGANTILDLGCGSGRHVVYFAKQGFSVYGLDNSSTGLEIAKGWLSKENLKAELVNLEMTDKFPWKNSFFDAVISTAVIHHADTQIIKKIIAEVERVLKKGGLIFIQVPKQKNQAAKYKQIESNTFVPIDGPEAGLPHHYFTQEELKDYFSNFDIQDIHIDEWNHYCMTGRKH